MSVGRLVGWSVCHKVTLPSLYRITCSSWQNINGLECFIYEVILITRFLELTVSDMLTETDKREICKPEPVSEIFISCYFFFKKNMNASRVLLIYSHIPAWIYLRYAISQFCIKMTTEKVGSGRKERLQCLSAHSGCRRNCWFSLIAPSSGCSSNKSLDLCPQAFKNFFQDCFSL